MCGIVLLTEDIEVDYQFLKEKGANVEPIQAAQWGQYIRVFDPDGNGWVIQQKRR